MSPSPNGSWLQLGCCTADSSSRPSYASACCAGSVHSATSIAYYFRFVLHPNYNRDCSLRSGAITILPILCPNRIVMSRMVSRNWSYPVARSWDGHKICILQDTDLKPTSTTVQKMVTLGVIKSVITQCPLLTLVLRSTISVTHCWVPTVAGGSPKSCITPPLHGAYCLSGR